MIISILTLFPEIFNTTLNYSILGRAIKKNLVEYRLINIRDFADDKHKTVDDRPYGGGVGMLLRVDIVERAIANSTLNQNKYGSGLPRTVLRTGTGAKLKEKIVLLDPAGKQFTQAAAKQYSKLDHLILVCGHYEGIDARIHNFVDESISIGQYITTGGEIPSMVITEAVTRLIPGVLNKSEAIEFESFSKSYFLEQFQYTRPPVYKGYQVPKILLSGNHREIRIWQNNQSEVRSYKSSSE